MARQAQEVKEYKDLEYLMPVGFVGHGAPTLALEKDSPAPSAWREWGRTLQKPKAILVVSAHWLQKPPHLGPINPVPLTYDFQGFPEELSQVEYPAPPAPLLSKEVLQLLVRMGMKPGTSSNRGLDHGAWVPLLHLFPRADIPVLQISIGTEVHMGEHLALGQALAPLRSKGVLILGSGNISHNLRLANFGDRDAAPEPWAVEFDSWCAETLTRFDLKSLADHAKAPGASMAVPTDDHFTPLLVVAAAAGKEGKPQVRFPHEGFEHGTVSMRCVEFS